MFSLSLKSYGAGCVRNLMHIARLGDDIHRAVIWRGYRRSVQDGAGDAAMARRRLRYDYSGETEAVVLGRRS